MCVCVRACVHACVRACVCVCVCVATGQNGHANGRYDLLEAAQPTEEAEHAATPQAQFKYKIRYAEGGSTRILAGRGGGGGAAKRARNSPGREQRRGSPSALRSEEREPMGDSEDIPSAGRSRLSQVRQWKGNADEDLARLIQQFAPPKQQCRAAAPLRD